MAGLLLQVGSMDLTSYVRAQPDEGLDPMGGGDHIVPQFTGVPALQDGRVFTNDAVDNRKIVAPLWLKSSSADGTLTLLSQLRQACVKGTSVQYRAEGSSQISWLDLEGVEIKPAQSHWYLRAGWMKVGLLLHCRPHATTGTTRQIASLAGAAAFTFPVTGVIGDIAALGQVDARATMTGIGDLPRVFAFGVHRSASYQPIRTASAIALGASAVTLGASGAIASQFVAPHASDIPSGAISGYTDYLQPGDAFAGRHRVFLVWRNAVGPASAMALRLQANSVTVGATIVPTITSASQWQVADLGEISVPRRPSGQGTTATYPLGVGIYRAGGSAVASPHLGFNALLLLPLDEGPVIRVYGGADPGGLGNTWQTFDSYPEVRTYKGNGSLIRLYEITDSGVRAGGPRIPVVGSPGASGPARAVVFDGNLNNFVGNANVDISLAVRERFQWMRS